MDDLTCKFSVCRSTVATRWKGFLSSISGIGAFGEVRVCPEHERILDEARKTRGATVRISLEGWVWVDVLEFWVYR